MAQWTLRYTTVEDPSNYITVIGNIGHSHGNVPWDGMNDNEIPNLYNVNITGLKNAYDNGAITFTSVPSGDTEYILPFHSMFGKLYYLDEFSDTSNMTSAYRLFYNCKNLITIPNFNTSNVRGSLREMFYNCYNLINIPNFNTSNVIDMYGMFEKCTNLTTIPNFNTINVIDMSSMFEDCSNLTTIPLFNTSNVTSMYSMFTNCYNLIDIPLFNTSNVTNMSNMFNSCYNLSNLSLKNITRSLPNVSQLTSQNSNLQNIGLSQNQINYISTTRYASQLQARGWNIADNYVKPALVKSVKMKQTDGTMNLAMLGTNAEYVDMEDGTTLEETVQNLKQYIDDNVANILGGMY